METYTLPHLRRGVSGNRQALDVQQVCFVDSFQLCLDTLPICRSASRQHGSNKTFTSEFRGHTPFTQPDYCLLCHNNTNLHYF